MGRLINIALVAAMIVGAALTYQTKHHAVEAAEHVADLRNRIEQERIAISLLKAEWSVLNQPDRLQALVGRYTRSLALEPFDVSRMVRVGDIPLKPIGVPGPEGQRVADGIASIIESR
jgi:hypothetical protein